LAIEAPGVLKTTRGMGNEILVGLIVIHQPQIFRLQRIELRVEIGSKKARDKKKYYPNLGFGGHWIALLI